MERDLSEWRHLFVGKPALDVNSSGAVERCRSNLGDLDKVPLKRLGGGAGDTPLEQASNGAWGGNWVEESPHRRSLADSDFGPKLRVCCPWHSVCG